MQIDYNEGTGPVKFTQGDVNVCSPSARSILLSANVDSTKSTGIT